MPRLWHKCADAEPPFDAELPFDDGSAVKDPVHVVVNGVKVDKKRHKELGSKPLTITVDGQGVLIQAETEKFAPEEKASWDWDQIQEAVAKKALLTVKVAVGQKNKSYEFTMPSKEQAAEVAAAIKAGDTVAAGGYEDLGEPPLEDGLPDAIDGGLSVDDGGESNTCHPTL